MSTAKGGNVFDTNGDGRIDEAEMAVGLARMMAPVDRERLCNDSLNTSVIAALVGGFALGSLQEPGSHSLDRWVYLSAYVAVHACTCSALTSAFIYAAANRMEDAAVRPWADRVGFWLRVPMMKFIAGCMCYMTSVILASYRDLGDSGHHRSVALLIGVLSMGMVWVAFAAIQRSLSADLSANPAPARVGVHAAPKRVHVAS